VPLPDETASRDNWTGRYEELRRRVIDEAGRLPRGPGVAIFVRQGLMAWMQAWPEEAGRSISTPSTQEPARLPVGLYEDVTQLLVDMIFHHRQEVHA
jgi:hypothetical protein